MNKRNGNDKLWEAANQALAAKSWDIAAIHLATLNDHYQENAVDGLGEPDGMPPRIAEAVRSWNAAAYRAWGIAG